MFILAVSAAFAQNAYPESLFSGITVLDNKDGVKIYEIKDKTPMKDAGIKKGDIITSIDGKEIKKTRDYLKISKSLKDGNETVVVIKRDNKTLSITVGDYSVPIKEIWDEKVAYSNGGVPKSEDPFGYWIGLATRKLGNIKESAPCSAKINIYEDAIDNAFNALHYKPKRVMAVVLIADTHLKVGECSINSGLSEKAVKSFMNAVRLYQKAMKKTSLPKSDLIKIRDNLKKTEELLKGSL